MTRELTKDEAIAVKAIGDLVTKTEELNALKGDLRKLAERMREGRDYYEKDGSISMIPYLGKDCADMIEELLKRGE